MLVCKHIQRVELTGAVYIVLLNYVIKAEGTQHVKYVNWTSCCFMLTFGYFRYYINYKLMKKKVKQYAQQIENGVLDRRHVLKDFSRMLDNQVSLNFSYLKCYWWNILEVFFNCFWKRGKKVLNNWVWHILDISSVCQLITYMGRC